MIARITGRLEQVADGVALVDAGAGLVYEVLVPACDVERLSRRTGQDVVLHTIHYLEGDPSRGMQQPRLVGFLNESDRGFFRLFTTVKGIGARKALRALVRSPGEVAAAIAAKDAKFLVALPEIGKRPSRSSRNSADAWTSTPARPTPQPRPPRPCRKRQPKLWPCWSNSESVVPMQRR